MTKMYNQDGAAPLAEILQETTEVDLNVSTFVILNIL